MSSPTMSDRAAEFQRGFADGAHGQRAHVHRDIDADYTRGFDLGREALATAIARWAGEHAHRVNAPEPERSWP